MSTLLELSPKPRSSANISVRLDGVSVQYGGRTALSDISMQIPRHEIFGIIGSANAGKTTLLRCINRTIDMMGSTHVSGRIFVDGQDVQKIRNVNALRRRIGMVFPLPVGLPLSVYDNVAYAPRVAGIYDRAELDAIVEKCLRQSMLWDEVKDRLDLLGTRLSGGQQQRLTLARALSHQPTILCLDEFSIAIDPVTTMKIEEVLMALKSEMTIILVTNLTQQARRLADRTAFLNDGMLIEVNETARLFECPEHPLTRDYVTGAIG